MYRTTHLLLAGILVSAALPIGANACAVGVVPEGKQIELEGKQIEKQPGRYELSVINEAESDLPAKIPLPRPRSVTKMR